MESEHTTLFTLFVDNLPEHVGRIWFRKFFNQFGVVKDVYIPAKRSKVTNRKFGFVRYNCYISAEVALSKSNGFCIEDRKLFVKFASYEARGNKPMQKRDGQNYSTSGETSKRMAASKDFNLVKDGTGMTRSFADVLKGKDLDPSKITITAKVDINGDGNDWLSRSVIAKLPSLRSVESIKDTFYSEGVLDIQVKSLGGYYVLLTFPSIEAMMSMIEGPEVYWLGNFFDEVRPWSPDSAIEVSRTVWLNCYGVPLHAWNSDTFFSIGRSWGEPITLDDATSRGLSFSSGKVQISTTTFRVINQEINLEVNGRLYPIWVMEDQLVVSNMIREVCGCKCKGGDSLKLDKKEDDWFDDSEGDKLEDNGMGEDKDHIVDTVALREDVENVDSNNLCLSIVGEDTNRNKEEEEETTEAVHGMDDTRLDEDQHSQVPENVLLLEYVTDEESNDINSDDSSLKAKMTAADSDIEDCDLISTDPLIKYVDYMRHKKKHQSSKGKLKNPLWSKNPLKAAMFSKTNSRDLKENNSRRLKLGLKKGSIDGPTNKSQEEVRRMERRLEEESLASMKGRVNGSVDGRSLSTEGEASSDIRKRNAILIKEARQSMEINASLGVKFFGRETYNIKKFLEIQGVDISEQDIKAFIDLEEGTSISVEF